MRQENLAENQSKKAETSSALYTRDLIGLAILVCALLAAGFMLTKAYHLTLLTYSGIYAIAALGMFILFGYCGQISIGQAAFFGIGAYASALLVMRAGLPSLVAVAASVAISAAVGWVVCRPLLKLTTNYLAMATLAFGVIVNVIFSQAVSITGGLDPGMFGVPAFNFLGLRLSSTQAKFWLVSGFLCFSTLIIINIVHSRIGRAFKALKGSEVATGGLGVDVVRYKVAAFTLAAGLAGLAGSLFAFTQGSFSSSTFTVGLSIELLVMVAIGSISSLWGAIFGAAFITIFPTFLEHFELYKLPIFGAILLIVTIFVPDGLARTLFDSARAMTQKVGGRWR